MISYEITPELPKSQIQVERKAPWCHRYLH